MYYPQFMNISRKMFFLDIFRIFEPAIERKSSSLEDTRESRPKLDHTDVEPSFTIMRRLV